MTLSTTTWRLSSSTGTCWAWRPHCGEEAHAGAARPTRQSLGSPRGCPGGQGVAGARTGAQGSSTVAGPFPPNPTPTPSCLGHPHLGRVRRLNLCSMRLALIWMKVPRAVEAQGQAVVDLRPG